MTCHRNTILYEDLNSDFFFLSSMLVVFSAVYLHWIMLYVLPFNMIYLPCSFVKLFRGLIFLQKPVVQKLFFRESC